MLSGNSAASSDAGSVGLMSRAPPLLLPGSAFLLLLLPDDDNDDNGSDDHALKHEVQRSKLHSRQPW